MTNIVSCAPLAAGWNTFSAKTVVFSQKNIISSASSASYSNISSGLFILANHTVSLDNRRSRGPKLGAHAPTTSQPRETVNGCQVRDLPNMHNCQELSSLAASASLQLGVSVLRWLTMNDLRVSGRNESLESLASGTKSSTLMLGLRTNELNIKRFEKVNLTCDEYRQLRSASCWMKYFFR